MLVKHMNELAQLVSKDIPNINWGGCAVFASLVGLRLKEYYDVKVVIYTHKNKGKVIDDVRPLIRENTGDEWNRNGVYFGHIILEYVDKKGKTRHYDSCGVYKPDGSICLTQDRIPGYLSIDECTELANDEDAWNSAFNRRYIPTMKRIINKYFDGVGKKKEER